MNKIIIKEDYRGFQISFDVDKGLFYALSESAWEEDSKSTTLKGIQKIIDDFIKENEIFEPFIIIDTTELHSYGKIKKVKIDGIRKDKRFHGIDEQGKDVQIGEYYIKDYHFPTGNELEISVRIKNFENQKNKIREEEKEYIKSIEKDIKPFKDWVKKKFPEIKIKD